MTTNPTNPDVDFYFNKAKKWQQEIRQLREIVLACPLNEELKWGVPCYMHQQSNIVLIHVFKEYCALLFFKGALMTDPNGILIQQTANVQAARQIRFTEETPIAEMAEILKSYILEAIAVEKSGQEIDFKKTEDFPVVEEFQRKLEKMPALKTAFEALTPGRQRAYLLHFSAAKQAKTREARVEKYMPQIMEGKGLND